jgi:hypothetical protein
VAGPLVFGVQLRRFAVVGLAFATLPLTASVGRVSSPDQPPEVRTASTRRAGPANLSVQAACKPGPMQHRHEFFFTRAIYSEGGFRGRRGNGAWATDWPKADDQLLSVLQRLARELDSCDTHNEIRLDDPELRRFPFIYAVEVGAMYLSDPEIKGLRDYLMAGGFLFVDDFWGMGQWQNFEANIKAVLPEYQIVDLPITHEIFRTYYEIENVLQVPSINNGCNGGSYSESGMGPSMHAIFNEHGRLLVLIDFNSDMGDAWEWMEQPCYPLREATYAYQLAVNTFIYAMSH